MKRSAAALSALLLFGAMTVAGCGDKKEAPPLQSGSSSPAQSSTPAAEGAPQNTTSAGGVVSGAQGKLMDPSSLPTPRRASGNNSQDLAALDAGKVDGKVRVIVYQDPMCPYCKQFDDQYGKQLDAWADAGDIVLDHRVISFLDQMSTTNYSTRSANALACVADGSPDAYTKYLHALYKAHDPKSEGGLGVEEGGSGLTDTQLAELAQDSGASSDVSTCISNQKFSSWVKSSTSDGLTSGVKGTPTVIVNGEPWDSQADADFGPWAKKAIKAAS